MNCLKNSQASSVVVKTKRFTQDHQKVIEVEQHNNVERAQV